MVKHKYHSLFTLCLAGMLLSLFSPMLVRDYFPTEFCHGEKVKFYFFARHTWLRKGAHEHKSV